MEEEAEMIRTERAAQRGPDVPARVGEEIVGDEVDTGLGLS